VQRSLDARARRPIADVGRGDATIATYSVVHDRSGDCQWALVVADLPDGGRCYARALDPDLLAAMEAEEWVGRPVQLTDGGGGVNLAVA
jgi:acetyl-CoA C-acetyltransferase